MVSTYLLIYKSNLLSLSPLPQAPEKESNNALRLRDTWTSFLTETSHCKQCSKSKVMEMIYSEQLLHLQNSDSPRACEKLGMIEYLA